MKKHSIMLTLVALMSFFSISSLFAIPTLKNGWPYLIGEDWYIQACNQLAVYRHAEEGWIIAVASDGELTLLDLEGNHLEGWPLLYQYANLDSTGAILQGPRLGDMNGDRDPEIAFRTQVNYPFVFNLEVYDYSGERLSHLCVADTVSTREEAVCSCPVFVDISGDGSDELVRMYGNAIHAQNYNGEEYPGFPIDIGDYCNKFNLGCVVGAGPGWDHDYNVVIWSTQDHVHAQRIGDDNELAGWPIEVNTPNTFSGPSLISTEDGWIFTIHCQNTLYAWDQDGQMLEGFPIRYIDSPHTSLAMTGYLTISDINGDSQPEILYRNWHDDLNVFTLEGDECRGFPVVYLYQAEGEQPVVMYHADSDSAYIHFGSMLNYRSIVTTAFHYFSAVQDYEVRTPLSSTQQVLPKTNTALIPPENDTLYVVSYNRFEEYGVRVYEIPMEGDGTHIEWQMPGNNAGGNRLYCPRYYLDVDELEETSPPQSFRLEPAYPNPWNNTLQMDLGNNIVGDVTISVYNILGSLIHRTEYYSGNCTGKWAWHGLDRNGVSVSSGIYLINVETSSGIFQQKTVLLK